MTSHTSEAGVEALRSVLEQHGYGVSSVRVKSCLHLKSAATAIGPASVIINPAWISPATFDGLDLIEVDPDEPYAANVLSLDDTTLVSRAHSRTLERMEERGLTCCAIDVSELAKAEGALTCCSILFEG